jgi:hypothetical protein
MHIFYMLYFSTQISLLRRQDMQGHATTRQVFATFCLAILMVVSAMFYLTNIHVW